MSPLTRADLWSLEDYAEQRPAFRDRVLAHKRNRQLGLGDNARLYFEDRLTIQYQIQEMLRIEKIFEAAGIEEELEAYNPLIPNGQNWKATFMLEFADPDERAAQLALLVGIEDQVWLQIEGYERILAVANEDLPRSTEAKTSAVHFLRFELSPAMLAATLHGNRITAGIDHPGYSIAGIDLPPLLRECLCGDLEPSVLN